MFLASVCSRPLRTYAARKELKWPPTANESLFVMDMNWK